MEAPKIRLEDNYKIRILVCYLLHNIGAPLTEKQLLEITTEDDMVNYFDLMQALNGIDNNQLCTVTIEHGKNVYAIAENGIKALEQIENHVPLSIREKCLKTAFDIMNRAKNKKRYESRIVTLEKGFHVKLVFPDPIQEQNQIELLYYADTYEKALALKEKADASPKSLYNSIRNFFDV